MPPKKLKGTEMTSAQGQETTRKISARVHWLQSPLTSEGTTASSTAAMTTQGVYTRANLVMKFSARAFLLPAFSTRSRILETVDSPNAFVTRTRNRPALVDAAADDVVALAHVAGQALARQRRGVQRRAPFQHHAVQRHALAGLDHDDVAHGHLVGIDLLRLAVALQVGVVRPYLHQLGDGLPRAPHRVGLEQLAHLVKQHHEHGLGVFAGGERAHRGQRHEEVFVKHLPVGDVAHRLPQNVPADDGVGDEEG